MEKFQNSFDLSSTLMTACSLRSLSGLEDACTSWFLDTFAKWDWEVEKIAVAKNRDNLFFFKGTPKILFTTHLDVVDGPDECFIPRESDGKIFARGACDAKGSAISMLAACDILLAHGYSNFGLLLVVGEEDDGIGAQIAAKTLKNRGIQFLINGEPTDGYLASRQFGAFDISFEFTGQAVHSGYPQYGIDANEKLFSFVERVRALPETAKKTVGISSINFGLVSAGISATIVSPKATLKVGVRTFKDQNLDAISLLSLLAKDAEIKVSFNCPGQDLFVPDGFQGREVYYCSDVPNFSELGATPLMIGPGNILHAHTANEYVTLKELHRACDTYLALYKNLAQ